MKKKKKENKNIIYKKRILNNKKYKIFNKNQNNVVNLLMIYKKQIKIKV